MIVLRNENHEIIVITFYLSFLRNFVKKLVLIHLPQDLETFLQYPIPKTIINYPVFNYILHYTLHYLLIPNYTVTMSASSSMRWRFSYCCVQISILGYPAAFETHVKYDFGRLLLPISKIQHVARNRFYTVYIFLHKFFTLKWIYRRNRISVY